MAKEHLPADFCVTCGNCCKCLPGAYHPSQFKNGTKDIKELIEKEIAVIDWWEGDPRIDNNDDPVIVAYFVRAKAKNDREGTMCPSWGGECIHLRINGCSLKRSERPLQCLVLKPIEGENCILPKKYNKQNLSIAWLEAGIDLRVFAGEENVSRY